MSSALKVVDHVTMATLGTKLLRTMMKTSPRIQQADPADTASAEAHAQSQVLAAQRMSEFLDSLPRDPADPSVPSLTPKEIKSLVQELLS